MVNTVISKEEYAARFEKVAAMMSARGLDALVVLDIERPTQSGNIRYMTGFFNTLANLPAALVITPPRMALCIAPGFFGSQVRHANAQAPWLKDIVASSPHFFKPALTTDIRTALANAGFKGKKVGLDGLSLVSEATARGIRTVLNDFELIEDTGIIEKIRLIKSPAEIILLREASRLTDVGVTAFRKAIRTGVRQNVAITNAESAGVEDGADEVSMYMAAGEPWIWGKFRSDRPFQKGDMVCTEFNARFRGYYGQVGRTFVVGKATDVQRRSYETAVQAYRAMAGKLKPGVTAGELFDAGDTVVTGAGYQSQKLRSGHGMGLTYGEGFDIDHGDRTVMQTGHYVMFHVMAAVSDQGPYSFAGNAMIVTSGGAEELNQAAFSLETE